MKFLTISNIVDVLVSQICAEYLKESPDKLEVTRLTLESHKLMNKINCIDLGGTIADKRPEFVDTFNEKLRLIKEDPVAVIVRNINRADFIPSWQKSRQEAIPA